MNEQQEKELADLTAAVLGASRDVTAKVALAAAKDAEAAAAHDAASQALKDASAARDTLGADVKKLKDFVDRLFDPVVGIDVKMGDPTTR